MHHVTHGRILNRQLLQGIHIDLIAKVPGVGDQYTIFHRLEVFTFNGVTHTGHGQDDIRLPAGFEKGHYLVTVHRCIGCLDGVHLADDDLGAQAVRPQRTTAATPAKANNCNGFARQHQVGTAHHCIPYRLTGAVHIIKQVLAACFVDQHHREVKFVGPRECLCTQYARGGFLANTENIRRQFAARALQQFDDITSIIDHYIGADIQCQAHMLTHLIQRRAVLGIHMQSQFIQCCDHIILG